MSALPRESWWAEGRGAHPLPAENPLPALIGGQHVESVHLELEFGRLWRQSRDRSPAALKSQTRSKSACILLATARDPPPQRADPHITIELTSTHHAEPHLPY